MTKTHNDYWTKRSDDIMRYVDSTDVDMFAELQKIYVDQSAEIQRDLFAFVTQYADDNKISYSDALQRLRGVDLSNYQANAETYRKQAEKDPELLKRLNEQYVSSKVTRLDALNLEMTYKIGVMQGVLETSFENYLKSTASYVYRKAIGGNSGALNEPALKELINTPFNGRNYSQQLWGNTDDLANDLRNVLKRGFVRGDDVRSMAGELAKKYNVARARAQTLIRTDGTAIINRATVERYKNAGLKYYRISVHLDSRTSDICRKIDQEKKRYNIDEFEAGVTAPPFHYNCRSAVVPDDEEIDEKELENLKGSSYNQDMTNLDLMAKSQSFVAGNDIRVSAKKVRGTNYDFWAQDNTKKIRDTMSVVEDNLNKLSGYNIPRIVFVKKSRLPGWAGYDYKQDVLFISDSLNSESAASEMLLDNYFASTNLKEILVHELTHKKHWDTAKTFYKNNKKRYNTLEQAKEAMDSPVISYIKTQQAVDYNYLYNISEYADISSLEGKYNEVIAEVMTAGERLADKSLINKIKEEFKWK